MTAMDVRLQVHLEDGSDGLVWWGEVPEVPGFSVAADALQDLIARAQWALADVFADDGNELGAVAIELVDDGQVTGNPVMSTRNDWFSAGVGHDRDRKGPG